MEVYETQNFIRPEGREVQELPEGYGADIFNDLQRPSHVHGVCIHHAYEMAFVDR